MRKTFRHHKEGTKRPLPARQLQKTYRLRKEFDAKIPRGRNFQLYILHKSQQRSVPWHSKSVLHRSENSPQLREGLRWQRMFRLRKGPELSSLLGNSCQARKEYIHLRKRGSVRRKRFLPHMELGMLFHQGRNLRLRMENMLRLRLDRHCLKICLQYKVS